MIRFLTVLALFSVIGSATWAYSVKYETVLVAEKLKKRQMELRNERDAIAVLEAEWQLLNRPGRLATLAKPEQGMGPMSARQVVQPKDIPAAAPVGKTDGLDQLLTGALPAPSAPVTPKAAPAGGKAPAKAAGAPKLPAKNAPLALTGKKDSAAPKAAPAKAAAGKADGGKADGGKTDAAKTNAAKVNAGKANAPKAVGAPRALVPPAPVAAAPEKKSDGLAGLFKRILN